MPGFDDALADLASSISLPDLPASVVHEGRRLLVDTVGCILAGVGEPEVGHLADDLAEESSTTSASVLGSGRRVDAMWAAMVNATAGVWHDFDAGQRFIGGHPAVHVVPAGIAVAEREHRNGRSLLEATIAGYEVAARVGLGSRLRSGMHPHGTWPTVGAAATAALLAGLDREALREALRVSSSLTLATSFRSAFEGATVRNLFAGHGAAIGVLAVDLVQAGFTGEEDGIANVFGGIATDHPFDPGRALDGVGERWEIERGYVKLHACARYLHPAVDALLDAVGHEIDVDQIESVDVETFAFAASMSEPDPGNPLQARFSMPFALATALVNSQTGVDAFDSDALADQRVRDVAHRVRVREDPAMTAAEPDERGARVQITFRDGQTRTAVRRTPSGEFDDEPCTDEQVSQKFLALATLVLRQDAAEGLLQRLWAVEAVEDVAELAALSRPEEP